MMTNSDKPQRSAKPSVWSKDKALLHLADLCARSEQCEADLRQKLFIHSISGLQADEIIDYLYDNQFLDTLRYAKAFTRDKFKFNRWGRIKIKAMLRTKHIPAPDIAIALAEIDAQDYYDTLLKLASTAAQSLNLDEGTERLKLTRRLYARGFEPELISSAIADLKNENR